MEVVKRVTIRDVRHRRPETEKALAREGEILIKESRSRAVRRSVRAVAPGPTTIDSRFICRVASGRCEGDHTVTTARRVLRAVMFFLALCAPSGHAAAESAPETAIVPLRFVPIEGGQLKVGIEVSLGGGAPQLYTFDTGSSGFYAAYNPLWWPSFAHVGDGTIAQSYGDGVELRAERVLTTVGISSDVGELEAEVEMAKIEDAWGGALGPREESTWTDDVAAGKPPLFGAFYGDFGSGLVDKNGLFAVLPQLPGNLSSGFAVRLTCGARFAPTVLIGLTEAVRSRVTAWVPMQGRTDDPAFPGSGLPTYAQRLIAVQFALRRGPLSYAFSADSILDTGGPTTSIHEHGDLKLPESLLATPDGKAVRAGSRFRATAAGIDPGDDFKLDLVTGSVPGFNRIDVTRASAEPFVNLGLIPFLRHDVVFDVERGLVGFAPCSRGLRYEAVRQRGVLPRLPAR